MADLIDFNARRARSAVPPARLGALGALPGAQVLFFTGVRYERAEALEAPAEALDLSDRLDGTPRGSRGKGKRRA